MSELPAYDQAWVYPGYDKPFREYWGDRFEDIFVWFHPFFSVEGIDPMRDGYHASRFAKGVTAEKAYQSAVDASNSEVETLAEGSPSNKAEATVLSGGTLISSLDYPDLSNLGPQAIKLHSWSSVAKECGWSGLTNREICVGLMTSTGALHKEFARVDWAETLITHCQKTGVFPPSAGDIKEPMFPAINDLMNAAGAQCWVHQPEFDIDPVRSANFGDLDEKEWGHRGGIYLLDPKVLITVDWDSHFTLVAGPHDLITPWVSRCSLDGFFASPETRHGWWSQDIKQNQITARTLT